MDVNDAFASLVPGARKFAHSAMDAHANGDEEVFLLHAGVSVERLAKAVLAKKNPFLLMEMKGSDDILFQFAGLEEPAKIRTIGAAQAIKRLKRLGVLPQAPDPDLDELIELRNGVAHLVPTHDGSFDGLTVFVKATKTLLKAWGSYGLQRYWGPHYRLAKLTLSEAVENATRHYRQLLEQARYRFAERTKDLPPPARDAYVKARSASVDIWYKPRAVSMPYQCPACRFHGSLTMGAPVLIQQGKPGEAFPVTFACKVCDLRLHTPEELASARMDRRLPLVDLNGNRILSQAEETLWYAEPHEEGHE